MSRSRTMGTEGSAARTALSSVSARAAGGKIVRNATFIVGGAVRTQGCLVPSMGGAG